jgi:hypothetical protein
MRDFTLAAYKKYLQAIKSSYENILTFSEYFSAEPRPESFCLIRHDVDRKPGNALRMAELENGMGIKSTYYFRVKPHIFKPDIIIEIAGLRHEIGYHYESLSDANGDMAAALRDFENNLRRLRELAVVRTISMHGRPLNPYDNRDMWRSGDNHNRLIREYGILGEVYLDIDYTDIAYINDTGRNWTTGRFNRRDKVESNVEVDFKSGENLLGYLKSSPASKMVFQVHPERWARNMIDYCISLSSDLSANIIKGFIRFIRNGE